MGKSYAVITGASSGIGEEFANLLAKEGYNLVLVARSKDKLHRLALKLHRRYRRECKIIDEDLSDIEGIKNMSELISPDELTYKVSVNPRTENATISFLVPPLYCINIVSPFLTSHPSLTTLMFFPSLVNRYSFQHKNFSPHFLSSLLKIYHQLIFEENR